MNINTYFTLVFKSDSFSEQERRALVEKCSVASWGHAINERKALETEVERLRGITPEIPPYPGTGEGLPRYGVRWNGPAQPLAVSMEDGYWTPWHLADELVQECQRLRTVNLEYIAVCNQALQAKAAAEQERDQLKAVLSREESQHMNTVDQRDMTEQFADRLASGIAEALGVEIGEHSPANNPWAEAITAIEEFDLAAHDAEVIETWLKRLPVSIRAVRISDVRKSAQDYANQLRQQARSGTLPKDSQ